MEEPKTDPIRPTDDEARALARELIDTARFGALGVTDPETGAPMVTRIAVVPGPDGLPLTLVSTLSSHTAALDANPPARSSWASRAPRAIR
jgi:putative heme iron utilization protein